MSTSDSSRLNLLVASHGYWPVLGGAERLAAEVSEGLAARGHTVRVMTPVAARDMDGDRVPDAEEERNGVEIQRIRPTPTEAWMGVRVHRRPGIAAKFVRKRVKGRVTTRFARSLDASLVAAPADVVLALPHLTPTVRAAVRVASAHKLALSLVPMLHEDSKKWPAPEMRDALALADSVIAGTQHEATRLTESYDVDADAIRIAGTGAEPISHPAPWPRQARVLFLGRKVEQKGIAELFQAMAHVWRKRPDVELVLAGPPSTTIVDRLRAKLPAPQRQQVCSLDSVSEQAKEELLGGTACLVLPSREESFGIVLLEAWGAHTPVVTTDTPVLRCVVDHGVNGLLARRDDPAALGASLLRLLNDASFAEQLGGNGYAKLMKKHRWRHVVDVYEAGLWLAVERSQKRRTRA